MAIVLPYLLLWQGQKQFTNSNIIVTMVRVVIYYYILSLVGGGVFVCIVGNNGTWNNDKQNRK